MKAILYAVAVLVILATAASSEDARLPLHRLVPVPIQQVTIEDEFWSPRLKVWQEVTIPDCFTKFENDRGGAINNFDRVAGGKMGNHAGPEWYDGLIYEMIRASADFIATRHNAKLKERVEGYIKRIAAAADKDPQGYIETWTQLMAPDHRWGLNGGNDVAQHELYNAGALVDAAIHWHRATGETQLLKVAVRMANDMCQLIGPPPKINQVPGHELGEEALVNLYLLFREQPELKSQMPVPVNESDYLNLAEFWIDNRGNHQGRSLNWDSYAQDDLPVLQQQEMEGHAVRGALLCAGIVAAGNVTGREDYLTTAQRLWKSMVQCKMYVTGGLGSASGVEGFGPNFDLPNKTSYCETCASAAGGFFSLNMNLAFADAQYADALERELFNGALVGVSLKGDGYFYDNPLEAGPHHERWSWHPCPCCPPMFLKLMSGLPSYIYAQEPDAAYVNLFVGSRATVTLNGCKVSLRQTTRYPWGGQVKIAVEPEKPTEFDLFIRIPAWCQEASSADTLYHLVGRPSDGAATLKVNGRLAEKLEMVRGYARLHRQWQAGDVVELSLDMPVRQVWANPQVEADRDSVALIRGPVVYCVESVDNPQGIRQLVVPPNASFRSEFKPDLLGGVTVVQGQVSACQLDGGKPSLVSAELTAVPYFANANRSPCSMRVWLPAKADKAVPATLATRSRASASYCWNLDSVDAMNDGIVPAKSSDTSHPRLSWWDHKGTTEWAELDFPQATEVSKVRVFWFADRPANGGCDVPQNWSLAYKDGGDWKPVDHPSGYGLVPDRFNDMTFKRIKTTALRIQVQLQQDWSGGICEWQVE
jgi:DUF1680 family protein